MDKCAGGLLSKFLEISSRPAPCLADDVKPCPRCAGRRSTWVAVAITTLTSQPVAAVQEFRPAFSWRTMNARGPRRRNAMSRNPDISAFQKSVATLPLATFRPNEIVLAAGSKTGRLLILKQGAVVIVEEGIEIAKVTEPGAVFGEVSALLDTPHTADVRALEVSQFYVADADLLQDKAALRHVAAILARRLVNANEAFIELKRHLEVGQPRDVVNKAVEKIQELIGGI